MCRRSTVVAKTFTFLWRFCLLAAKLQGAKILLEVWEQHIYIQCHIIHNVWTFWSSVLLCVFGGLVWIGNPPVPTIAGIFLDGYNAVWITVIWYKIIWYSLKIKLLQGYNKVRDHIMRHKIVPYVLWCHNISSPMDTILCKIYHNVLVSFPMSYP